MKHEWKVAWRNLLKYKTQNLISIIGLAVGLLSFSVCLYCSRYMENIDTSFTNYRRLVDFSLYRNNKLVAGTPAKLADDLRTAGLHEVEAISCVAYPTERDYYVETAGNERLPYTLTTLEVDSFYNRLFTPEIVAGNWHTASLAPNSLILTETAARRMFGTATDPVGKTMTLAHRLYTSGPSTPREGGIVYTVGAVIRDLPQNTSMGFFDVVDMLVMNDTEGMIGNKVRKDITGAHTYALLSPGKRAADLQQKLDSMPFTIELFQEKNTARVSPIGVLFKKRSELRSVTLIAGLVGFLILLSGLLNFFHFQTGSFLNRTREYSVRKVAGGSSFSLFKLLFIQAILVLLLAFVVLLCGAELLRPYLNLWVFGVSLTVDLPGLLVQSLQYMAVLLAVCAVICAATTWRISRTSVQDGLQGAGGYTRRRWLRNAMLGIQFFIGWIFISFTLAFYLQSEKTTGLIFNTLSRQEKAEILSIPLDYDFMENTEKQTLIHRIGGLPGVEDVLVTDIGYLQGSSGTGMYTERGNSNTYFEANLMIMPENFISFMHIPLVRGKAPVTGTQMLVDRDFAEEQKEEVLGKTYYNYNDGYTVTGVVEPFRTHAYSGFGRGYIFLPADPEEYIGHCYVKSVSRRSGEVRDRIERLLRETLPSSVTPRISTVLEDIRRSQPVENEFKGIIFFFSVVSLVVALLGVYSAVTLDTERRQKEVAIRKINGAGKGRIVYLFARLYIGLLAVTALLAFPLVGAVLTVMRRMYTDFFNFGFFFWAAIFCFVALVTACTVVFRILRIARLNPAEVIKHE